MFSFHDLEIRHGPVVAYQCLAEIEKAARIRPSAMTGIDPETRLANALRAQDAMRSVLELQAA
jgi:hypothetical protein